MSDTTTTEMSPSEHWASLRQIWLEDDPGDAESAAMRKSTEAVRAIVALGSLADSSRLSLKTMKIGAKYTATIVSSTMSKTMYELVKSVDEHEAYDDATKAAIVDHLGALCTVLSAATDAAVRVADGKNPVGDGSFTQEMRDLFDRKRDGGQ